MQVFCSANSHSLPEHVHMQSVGEWISGFSVLYIFYV